MIRLKPLREQVLVITGASSGIGLATAKMAAQQGARVVLAARNGDALAAIERDIAAEGGQAAHVVADVGNRENVRRIADAAVQRFGGFDTWVNNAGTGIFGKLTDLTDEDQRRVFDTNFWGVVYGSVAAVRHLKQRGGALINVGSVLSDVAIPVQGMYVASKHAVLGFTDSLRMELEEERAPVSVTLIRPSSIDTPYPKHARNYFDHEPKLPGPVYSPDVVAAAILTAAEHPQRDVYVGGAGRVMSAMARHLPETMDWVGARVMAKEQFRDEPPRNPAGSLHRPGRDGDGRIRGDHPRGDHPGMVMPFSLYTRTVQNPVLASLLAVGAGIVASAFLTDAPKGRK